MELVVRIQKEIEKEDYCHHMHWMSTSHPGSNFEAYFGLHSENHRVFTQSCDFMFFVLHVHVAWKKQRIQGGMTIFSFFFNFVKPSNSLKVGLSHKNESLSRAAYVILAYFLLLRLEIIWKILHIAFLMNGRKRGSEPNSMMPVFNNSKDYIQQSNDQT